MFIPQSTLLIFNMSTGEILVITVLILLLFGGKKIPELMKGLGKGVKSFKQGMNEIQDEISKPVEDEPKSNSDKKEEKK